MKKTKTIGELAERIDEILKKYDFSPERRDSALILTGDGDSILTKIVGHNDIVATSIASAMVDNEDLRVVMIAALSYYRQILLEQVEDTAQTHTTRTNQRFS